MPNKKQRFQKNLKKILFLIIGSALAGIGLEIFLIPNNIIDGGIVGISIMAGYLTKWPIGAFIFILNIPFFIFGYTQIGKSFTISTVFSVAMLSIWVSVLRPVPGITQDVFLASVFGGIILGIGVGLIIRHGGSLDGTEIIAIILNRKTTFSVGEIVMVINLFILSSAGLVFGWDRAMYSLVAYFIAYKVIDLTIEGLDESKEVMIISDKYEEITEGLMVRLGRGVTRLQGEGGFKGESKGILYCVVTRLEIAELKSILNEIDDNAFVTISNVHEVMGGRFKKRSIH